jgi:hypothetical protein
LRARMHAAMDARRGRDKDWKTGQPAPGQSALLAAAHADNGAAGLEAAFEALCAHLPEPRDAAAKQAVASARSIGIALLLAKPPATPNEVVKIARLVERFGSSALKTGNAYSNKFIFSKRAGPRHRGQSDRLARRHRRWRFWRCD